MTSLIFHINWFNRNIFLRGYQKSHSKVIARGIRKILVEEDHNPIVCFIVFYLHPWIQVHDSSTEFFDSQ